MKRTKAALAAILRKADPTLVVALDEALAKEALSPKEGLEIYEYVTELALRLRRDIEFDTEAKK